MTADFSCHEHTAHTRHTSPPDTTDNSDTAPSPFPPSLSTPSPSSPFSTLPSPSTSPPSLHSIPRHATPPTHAPSLPPPSSSPSSSSSHQHHHPSPSLRPLLPSLLLPTRHPTPDTSSLPPTTTTPPCAGSFGIFDTCQIISKVNQHGSLTCDCFLQCCKCPLCLVYFSFTFVVSLRLFMFSLCCLSICEKTEKLRVEANSKKNSLKSLFCFLLYKQKTENLCFVFLLA